MDAQKPLFLDGAKANGIPRGKAEEIWNLLDKFANYGFNKSHAAAYAVVSYQTAWLKANHPVEFMAAVMNCDIHLTDKLGAYKQETDRLGMEMVPPCVNRSGASFSVADGRIVYALGALKNVGVEAMRLRHARPGRSSNGDNHVAAVRAAHNSSKAAGSDRRRRRHSGADGGRSACRTVPRRCCFAV
jgi:DNA polymerase-3 subunit alpha